MKTTTAMTSTDHRPTSRATRTHHRTCHLCEAMCGVVIEAEGDRIVSIKGDEKDPLSKGHVCPKALALQDIHEDPDRLRTPLRRTSNGWEPIGWDEALDLAANKFSEIRSRHGKDAMAVYLGNPTVHNYGTLIYGVPFIEALKTRNRYSATSVDQLPRMLASLLVFGNQVLLPIPDLDRTRYFLCIGANPVVSNGSVMTAPGASQRIAAIKQRGGTVVVLDPRRTETAKIATAHHFVRPGSDALVLLSLIHVVFEENLSDPGRLAPLMDGLPTVRDLAKRFPPEKTQAATGLAPEVVREIARGFAKSPAAVAYGRIGTSTQEFGGIASWLVDVLNAITGNLDREGGSLFPTPAVDILGLSRRAKYEGSYDTWRSRVRKLPEFGHEQPVATLSDEIETPGEGQVRALLTVAGNPVLSTPNGTRLDGALDKLEFMVSIDFYLNETTRHAHLILPPTFGLEHDQYDIAFHAVSVRNTAKFAPAFVERGPEQRHDWEILHGLATRMMRTGSIGGLGGKVLGPVFNALGKLGPARLTDFLIRSGPRGDGFNPFSKGLSLKKIAENPHGIDLGPLEPSFPANLGKRRIQLAPAALLGDVPRLEAWMNAQTGKELVLIGRRQLRSNNSWMHNTERLLRGKPRCTLLMNPEDAKARGLEEGATVTIRSRVGAVNAPVELTPDMMPGVVSLPHGWGHARKGIRLSVASAHPGVSVNDLTDETFIDTFAGTAALSGVPVTVEKTRTPAEKQLETATA